MSPICDIASKSNQHIIKDVNKLLIPLSMI